ncbi:MAG: hypothetical protein IT442_11225 [Phycisphaeraceae bacterium]|nr:hypothetical protein [Phycisphaeraceae bacterium]
MMAEHDSHSALWVSALLAAGLHLAGMPVLVGLTNADAGDTATSSQRQIDGPPPIEQRQVAVGSPEAPRRTALAWISYEDYRKLTVPDKSTTEQPAMQSKVEPVEHAPIAHDPEKPAPSPSLPTLVIVSPPPKQQASEPVEMSDMLDLPSIEQGAILPPTPAMPPVPTLVLKPSVTPEATRGTPTSAPKANQDVAPVKVHADTLEARPGGVLVTQGLEITVARPQFTIVTRLTTVPNNTQVRVVFGPDGTVVQATLLKSTGYADVDGPVLASLYAWKARGEALGQHGVELTIRYLLRPEEP